MREVLNNVRDCLGHDATGEARFAARTEGDRAGGESEEGMVAPDRNILTRFNLRAALSDDDHAGARLCAVGELNAEVFRIRSIKIFR